MKWEEDEIEKLIECYRLNIPTKEIAILLNRSTNSICQKASKLCLYKQRPWSVEDIDKLTDIYKNHTIKELAIIFNRTESAIKTKGTKLKIARPYRKTHDEFLIEIKDRPFITTSKYIRDRAAMSFSCNICTNTWKATPSSIIQGTGCPVCNKPGAYFKFTKKDFAKIPYLYLYRVVLAYKDEIFEKIGVTKSPEKRFSSIKPYELKEVLVMEKYKNAEQCYKDEQYIHRLYKDNSYMPKYKFSGHTECYIR